MTVTFTPTLGVKMQSEHLPSKWSDLCGKDFTPNLVRTSHLSFYSMGNRYNSLQFNVMLSAANCTTTRWDDLLRVIRFNSFALAKYWNYPKNSTNQFWKIEFEIFEENCQLLV